MRSEARLRALVAGFCVVAGGTAGAQTLNQAPDPTRPPAVRSAGLAPADVVAAVTDNRGPVQLPAPAAVRRGHDSYQRYCQACHGGDGDGRGDSADFLPNRPRDFTAGVYEFRSTPSGTLPTDADLFRSIRNGLWGSGMPGWAGISDGDIWDLVAYVESFSDRFYREGRGLPVEVPPEPARTPESVAAGKAIYEESGCASCHGRQGQGDGPSARDLKNEWGNPSRPAPFRNGHWKGGNKPSDLYRDLMTGLDGTPMPSYSDTLTPQQAWDLVHYLSTLSVKRSWRSGDSPGDLGQFDASAP